MEDTSEREIYSQIWAVNEAYGTYDRVIYYLASRAQLLPHSHIFVSEVHSIKTMRENTLSYVHLSSSVIDGQHVFSTNVAYN